MGRRRNLFSTPRRGSRRYYREQGAAFLVLCGLAVVVGGLRACGLLEGAPEPSATRAAPPPSYAASRALLAGTPARAPAPPPADHGHHRAGQAGAHGHHGARHAAHDAGAATSPAAPAPEPAAPLPATPATFEPSGGGPVHVNGYYRRDGTYVRPHTRSR